MQETILAICFSLLLFFNGGQDSSLQQKLVDDISNGIVNFIAQQDTVRHNKQKENTARSIEQINLLKSSNETNLVAENEEYSSEPVEQYYDDSYSDEEYYGSYEVPYDAAYNTNGPTRQMPGYYDGYLETYYSSNVLHHYMTDQWTADEEGFYRDDNGYYIIGVDESEGIPLGTVVETGKGEAIVMDYGSGMKVHDFYTNW